MESTELNWRLLAKRQWPLAVSLTAIALLETGSISTGLGWWQVPGVAVVCVIAVLAPRRPFDAALALAFAVACVAVYMRLLGVSIEPHLFWSGAGISMTGAAMATIATLVRDATRVKAVAGTLVVLAAMAFAEVLGWPIVAAREYREWSPDTWNFLIAAVVLLVLSVGTGMYFRARDDERASQLAASVAAAQNAERMALARELHDVVAHYVTAIVVHAQAGQLNREVDVLPSIASSGTEALTAMRRLVGTMRDGSSEGPAASSSLMDDVRALAAESGLPVRLSFDLQDAVPQELARSVLRLVQESLTNTQKHASAVSSVDVSLSSGDGVLHLAVLDDGVASGVPVGGSGGYGLVGMRERAELLGGTFSAGRREPTGWTVRADLPIS
ncbi:sensor histidine kinase [Lentzea albidocapillata]|uniref:histidine kinase n=1 Tax=Lentzea albidocapillata TaxID=40571 RepID=A0A1W2EI76_9PSEU|nr:histidine kinase [Lentzea albidocapillata]SMD09046.1 Signal transduction histidine kinase [Lentzea albidocapillata]